MNDNKISPRGEAESLYACVRLGAALQLMTIGGAAMYGVVVALPAVQAEFGVTRADASLPYTLTMIGFGVGGILMGRLADRFGVIVPVVIGALSLGAGFPPLRHVGHAVAIQPRAWTARRTARLRRDLRAPRRRYLDVVHAAPRDGGSDLRER